MLKKSRKGLKRNFSRNRNRSSASVPKKNTKIDLATGNTQAAVQKFVTDALTRGEAGTLKNGKLPLGKTFIIDKKKGATKLTRARFSLA